MIGRIHGSRLCPKLSDNIFVKSEGQRILYLNPEFPDWITINIRYKPIFDLFNGRTSVEEMTDFLRKRYPNESCLLVEQVTDLLNNSKIFSHNLECTKEELISRPLKLNSVYIVITDDCNLACRYCYVPERQKQNSLSFEKWALMVDKIHEVFKPICFVFTGGEPLMHPATFALARYIIENGSTCRLLTNGTKISNLKIAKKTSNLFEETRISLDSIDCKTNDYLRGKGVFEKVQKSIKLLNQTNANYIMQATVTKLNKDEIANFAKYFNNKVNFQPLYPKGRGRSCKELSITGKEYFNALTGAGINPFKNNIHGYRSNPCKRCSMGIGEVSISPSGDLYPCHMLHYPQFLIGSLIKNSFKNMYYNSNLLKKIRNINVDTINECSACAVKNFCAGACRARLDFQKEDLKGKDNFCIYEKETILDALMYSFG